jgi:hypothetical protein
VSRGRPALRDKGGLHRADRRRLRWGSAERAASTPQAIIRCRVGHPTVYNLQLSADLPVLASQPVQTAS